MRQASPPLGTSLAAAERALIRASCGHALVPDAPAASGYRYLDLGGCNEPFYLRRIAAGPILGAVTLTAPIELGTGEPAEPGAPGLARVGVSIGVTTVDWSRLLDADGHRIVWADLLRQALEELTQLRLLEAAECPICADDEN